MIVVTNSSGLTAEQEFDLPVVQPVPPTPPTLSGPNQSTVIVGNQLSIQFSGTSTDGSPLTLTLLDSNGTTAGVPTGMTLNSQTDKLTWMPTTPGVYDFQVQETGDLGTITVPFEVVVIPPPQPVNPVITSQPVLYGLGSSEYQYQVTVSDTYAPDTYTLLNGPTGMSINPQTGLLTWFTPPVDGLGLSPTFPVTIEVANPTGGTASQSFTLTLPSQGDAITSTPTTLTAVVGQTYEYNITAIGGVDLYFEPDPIGSTWPTGMTLTQTGPDTGVLTWTPTSDQVGQWNIAISTHAALSLQDFTQGLTLNVVATAPAVPPTITSTAPSPATIGDLYQYQVTASDENTGATLSYSLVTAPSGMTIDPSSGLVSWTPTSGAETSVPVTVEVTDSLGQSATQSFSLFVINPIVGTDPVFVSQPPTITYVGMALSYQSVAIDPQGSTLTYSIVPPSGGSIPTGLSIDPNSGILTWTPTESQAGTVNVTLQATDANGYSGTQTFSLEVVPSAAPVNPTITSTPTGPAFVNLPYQYQVTVTDTSNSADNFALTSAPAGMSIDPVSGLVTWTPTGAQAGSQQITVQVVNQTGGLATQTFTLPVDDVPQQVPPVISSTPPYPAVVGLAYQYQVVATDPDGSPLSYSLTAAPSGMTISSTGLITFTAQSSQVGSQQVAIVVADELGSVVSQSFTLPVVPTAVDQPPAIQSQPPGGGTIAAGSTYQYQMTASDPSGAPLTYAVEDGTQGMSIDPTTGLFSWTPAAGELGQFPVTLSVSDAPASGYPGGVTQQNFTLTVVDPSDAPNDQPVITSTAPGPAVVGLPYQYQVVASDPDGYVLTYSLTTAPAGMAISSAGLVTWTASSPGINTVTVTVTNSQGNSATQTFTLGAVANVPDTLPVFTSTPPTTALVGESFQYQAVAVDSDGSPITYSLGTPQGGSSSGGPLAGMQINSQTGLLTWTPAAQRSGQSKRHRHRHRRPRRLHAPNVHARCHGSAGRRTADHHVDSGHQRPARFAIRLCSDRDRPAGRSRRLLVDDRSHRHVDQPDWPDQLYANGLSGWAELHRHHRLQRPGGQRLAVVHAHGQDGPRTAKPAGLHLVAVDRRTRGTSLFV